LHARSTSCSSTVAQDDSSATHDTEESARADIRSQLGFETNVRAEIWAVHIGAALGIDDQHVEDVVRHAITAQNQTAESATQR
jgi:hypothetical protein